MNRILIFLLLLVLQVPGNGQKLGLVLSGGAAKGIAHIGVIQALEENEIPIDYLTGTSIGAIVGALYASGYSPAEMANLFQSDWFRTMASGKMETDQTYFFKKPAEDASWLELKFENDSGLNPILPRNIVSTHQMDLGFLEVFAPPAAAAGYDFNQLFIPFRCLATDIFRNQPIVFRSGDLAFAVRASMAIPFYFKPVRNADTLLYDGGMRNNFPLDIMLQDFNPDFVIGVKVARDRQYDLKEDLVSQIMIMMMRHQSYQVPDSVGILIEPQVDEFGQLDFDKFDQLYKKGYEAGLKMIPLIRKSIARRQDRDSLQARRMAFRKQQTSLFFRNLKIKGVNSTQRQYITQSMDPMEKGFGLPSFKTAYYRLLSDRMIGSIYPSTHLNPQTGLYDLFLDVERSKPLLVKFGGNVSSNSVNQAFLGINWHHLAKRSYLLSANSYFGRFYSSFQLGGRMDIPDFFSHGSDLGLPMATELILTYNRWDYYKSNGQLFFEDVKPSYLINNEFNLKSRFSIPLRNSGKLFTGASLSESVDEYYQTNEFSKNDTSDLTRFDHWIVFAGYETNTLDRKQFASRGHLLHLSLKFIQGRERFFPGSVNPFPMTNSDGIQFHTYFVFSMASRRLLQVSDLLTIGWTSEARISNADLFSNYTATLLHTHAFQPTPLSRTLFLEQYRSFSWGSLGLEGIFKLTANIDFRIEGHYFQPYRKIRNNGATNSPFFGTRFPMGNALASTSLILHNPVAPVSLTLGWFDKSLNKFVFVFNFGYILFNGKGAD